METERNDPHEEVDYRKDEEVFELFDDPGTFELEFVFLRFGVDTSDGRH